MDQVGIEISLQYLKSLVNKRESLQLGLSRIIRQSQSSVAPAKLAVFHCCLTDCKVNLPL